MPMSRPIIESTRKSNYSLSLNPDLVQWLRSDAGGKIENLSGWVNNQLRDEKLKHNLYTCPCATTASLEAWKKWELICPKCKKDHNKKDERKRDE